MKDYLIGIEQLVELLEKLMTWTKWKLDQLSEARHLSSLFELNMHERCI